MLINFWPLKGAKVSSPGVEGGGVEESMEEPGKEEYKFLNKA